MGNVTSRSNDEMVDNLIKEDLRTPALEKAFRLTDRGFFVHSNDPADIYSDRAYQEEFNNSLIHLSAPSIYCLAMEELQLARGECFLSIGSGTGYLNTIAGHMLGGLGTNHGIEIRAPIVEHAIERCRAYIASAASKCSDFCVPQFLHSDVMRVRICRAGRSPDFSGYHGIYVGATVSRQTARRFARLLRVGGRMIVPQGQWFLLYTRQSESLLITRHVRLVTFASMIDGPPARELHPSTVATLPSPAPSNSVPSLAAIARRAIRVHLLHATRATELRFKISEISRNLDETFDNIVPDDSDDDNNPNDRRRRPLLDSDGEEPMRVERAGRQRNPPLVVILNHGFVANVRDNGRGGHSVQVRAPGESPPTSDDDDDDDDEDNGNAARRRAKRRLRRRASSEGAREQQGGETEDGSTTDESESPSESDTRNNAKRGRTSSAPTEAAASSNPLDSMTAVAEDDADESSRFAPEEDHHVDLVSMADDFVRRVMELPLDRRTKQSLLLGWLPSVN